MTDYTKLPPHMQETARLYIEKGVPGGSFFTALCENNLINAFNRADNINAEAMKAWADFVYWEMPGKAWGDKDAVKNWISSGGLEGLRNDLG